MDEAQSLFDRYAMPVCPSQLTAPNLHRVLSHASLRKHIWGAKGVGSQASGRLIASVSRHAPLPFLRPGLGTWTRL
jgi:hypothetical protein